MEVRSLSLNGSNNSFMRKEYITPKVKSLSLDRDLAPLCISTIEYTWEEGTYDEGEEEDPLDLYD